ncbi:sorting nexin-14-like isoform X2 [Syngnathoides biaculeatus]|uniref:sorting nexin-14-like isoform X2 n=1 Tax=Syngnathoides biaculeatus TaxID=300417 RepID=UPI002ADE67B8|nr:sorting nexin-14-like isoform X2 [Syngnathoides biaculeatus]
MFFVFYFGRLFSRRDIKFGFGDLCCLRGATMALLSAFWRSLRSDGLLTPARQYPLACCLLAAMLVATVLLSRYLLILIGLWSFLAGAVTFYWALEPDSVLPNVLLGPKEPRKRQFQEQALFPSGRSCAVCGKLECKRHRGTLRLENFQPWLGLDVPADVDASVAEVFELVLENFVYPWYRDITDDEACVDQLRLSFRFLASVLVRRAQKVDFPAVFADHVMKAAVKHVEILAKAHARVRPGRTLQRAALDEYGADLHVAARGRRQEALYLRKLSEMLFPYLMPPKANECRSLALLLREVLSGSVLLPAMDFVADPDTVNLMVLKFVDDTPAEAAPEPPSARVPFLRKYADRSSNKPSVLKLELKEIREQQDLLFRFMNFLKQEGAVHVLQFLLAVEELNDKILSPELSDSELRRLHGEVVHIYQMYCVDESIYKINLNRDTVEDIRNVAVAPYGAVVKLQTMGCLFEAYEHVLSLLENVFTPMFCHSDEYFRHLLKGAESPARSSRVGRFVRRSLIQEITNQYLLIDPAPRNPSKRGESFGIGRIGSKIKGVFKSTTVEGAVLPPSCVTDADDDVVEEATAVTEDAVPASAAGRQRRLSAWTVAIPYVDLYEDEAKREKVPVFCIDVERNDRKEVGHDPERWSVCRRYFEFYVLESKLTEFHGAFADAQLPPKRILGPKNHEFLTSKRENFEDYLQKLLRYPELSNSQLLADFLSPHSVESQFVDRMLPDVNLGKIFKSVPGKLMKEKGQNLEPFIQSFFNSCESPKAKPSRPELTIVSPGAAANKRTFRNVEAVAEGPGGRDGMTEVGVDGMYDYMVHVGRLLFGTPRWLHRLLSAGRILVKNTFEAYVAQQVQTKIDGILQEHRLVSLITQLRDAIFYENSEERSRQAKQTRAEQTFDEMVAYLPDAVGVCIGEEAKREGVRLLFEGLQQPLLNKQMSYVLLDIAVRELFPELR